MTLAARIPKTTARRGALLFGCMCCVSCVTLLGEGLDHLRFFLPLAALNFGVGALTSERVARVFLAVEACVIFGLLAYTFFQLHERHAA